MSREREPAEVERAVIDRMTDVWAVLLVGDKEQERRVRVDDLPDGTEEGSIVNVRVTGLRVDVLEVDDEATEAKRSEIKDRLNRLKRTRSSDRFSRKE